VNRQRDRAVDARRDHQKRHEGATPEGHPPAVEGGDGRCPAGGQACQHDACAHGEKEPDVDVVLEDNVESLAVDRHHLDEQDQARAGEQQREREVVVPGSPQEPPGTQREGHEQAEGRNASRDARDGPENRYRTDRHRGVELRGGLHGEVGHERE